MEQHSETWTDTPAGKDPDGEVSHGNPLSDLHDEAARQRLRLIELSAALGQLTVPADSPHSPDPAPAPPLDAESAERFERLESTVGLLVESLEAFGRRLDALETRRSIVRVPDASMESAVERVRAVGEAIERLRGFGESIQRER